MWSAKPFHLFELFFYCLLYAKKPPSPKTFSTPQNRTSALQRQGFNALFQLTSCFYLYQDKVLTFCTDFFGAFFSQSQPHPKTSSRPRSACNDSHNCKQMSAIASFNAQTEPNPRVPHCLVEVGYHPPSPWSAVYHGGSPPCALKRLIWLPKAHHRF